LTFGDPIGSGHWCSFFGRPFVKRFALCYRSVVLSVLSVCLSVTFVHCGQTVGRIRMKCMQVGLGPGHIVLDGDPAPPPPKGHSPQFSAHICCDQMAAWIKMSLGMEIGFGPDDFVLDGSPPKGGGASPKFSAQVYCGQTARWMKLLLGMVVGLSPDTFVLDWEFGTQPPSPKRGGAPFPIFVPFLLWPNGWMHQDAIWYGCRPQPRGLCGRPSPPPQKGGGARPNFRPMFIVAKRLNGSRCHLARW